MPVLRHRKWQLAYPCPHCDPPLTCLPENLRQCGHRPHEPCSAGRAWLPRVLAQVLEPVPEPDGALVPALAQAQAQAQALDAVREQAEEQVSALVPAQV